MQLNTKKIGEFIHACRREQSMTQAELGERLGVSPQSVSNWERGESIPDVTLLPDLACLLQCSVDAILMGGADCLAYRRHVTVSQMREALLSIKRIGDHLGQDHFIYQTILTALNTKMNTTIEQAFSDPHIAEVFVIEFLLGCIENGDYVDPRDVQTHLAPSKAKSHILQTLQTQGIR